MKTVIYRVKVFSSNCDGGNLAGVVPDARELSAADMQCVAAWVGASETAFIFPSGSGDLRIRWFSPATEVRMCVHGTIAAAGVLLRGALVRRRLITFKSLNGALRVRVLDGRLFVRVPRYQVLAVSTGARPISQYLGIDGDLIVGDPKIAVLGGDSELVVEVRDLEALRALAPNRDAYSDLCRHVGVSGISICTHRVFERANDLHLREFAPCYGYLEDPVCGLGAGAVAVCLRRRFQGKKYVRVEQGVFLNTPGVVFVAIRKRAVAVGGHYVLCGQHDVTV